MDNREIVYLPAQLDDLEAVQAFLIEAGWRHRVSDFARFRKMVLNSDRTVVAWREGRVVGFGRALCDDVSNGYISMVAVGADHRGKGIGTEIVNRLMGDDPDITWVLRAGRESAGFWERMGFDVSTVAMERPGNNRQGDGCE
jgi:GNAT superfamily N-acetyltransferase